MKRLSLLLLLSVCIVTMSGCSFSLYQNKSTTGSAYGKIMGIYLPDRVADKSYDNSGIDIDSVEIFTLTDQEFNMVKADTAKNANWKELDKTSYDKIIGSEDSSLGSAFLGHRRVGNAGDKKREVINPFDYSNSFYCLYDVHSEKLINLDAVEYDWNLEFVVFDYEHKVIYISQQSI